jgi:hypothetical protein
MTRSRDVADTQDNLGGAVAPFVAGKNKIINGDFGIWQRGTSFALTAGYQADRWTYYSEEAGIVGTISQQTFTPGAAPVTGYEGSYFYRYNVTTAGSSGVQSFIFQKVEDVRTLANQTVTVSFWAKADTTRNLVVGYSQNFGSGGSASVIDASVSTAALTTSWQRFTATFALPSISGKTIGTGSSLHIRFYTPILTTQTIDIWGVQLEAGNVATPFTPAGGGFPGAELALCQRYFYAFYGSVAYPYYANGFGYNSTSIYGPIKLPVTMRTNPTCVAPVATAGIAFNGTTLLNSTAISMENADPNSPLILYTFASGITTNQSSIMGLAATGSLQFSAEL